ncbi:MAG: hypothetical protein OXH69_09420 [Acidobacteria bacterium]|nr:hypothetical protein [Acidobacteriota bacterium]
MTEPALVLSDVVAGPHPRTGTLLDPDRPRPVPVGSPVRSAGLASARRGHSMMGLAQSRDEANRWLEDAIRYRAPRAVGRGP